MQIIPLRPGVYPDAARQAVQEFLQEWADAHYAETLSIAGEMASGKITLEEAEERTVAVLEETHDRLRDELPEVLDRLWDFSAAPGGPVGAILEALDGAFWEGFLGLAREAGKWVVDQLTLDDLDRRRIVTRLVVKASELERRATEIQAERPKRAAHLQVVAARKRRRAEKIAAAIGE